MKSIIRLLVITCTVLLIFSFAKAEEGSWELISSKNGINTYRMTYPGTEVCSFKGVGFVDAKIEVIGEVMRDIPAYPQWMAKMKRSSMLKKINRNTYILYAEMNTPLPYKNRDFVIENQTKYNFNNGSALITFRSAKNFDFPEKDCCFRLTDFEGEYYLESFGRDKTRVTYQYRSHPGGNIPVGMANEFEIKHYPAITINGLRKMVKKKRYIEAALASPDHEMIERMLDNKKVIATILKNRMGEYIIDPELLNMLFEMTIPKRIVDNVYATRSDFASIRQGMIDLFNIVGDTDLSGKLKQDVDSVATYLADKNFDSFFSIKKFMGETWLVDEIAKNKRLIKGLFNMKSKLSKVIFEKATTSDAAVTSFIKNRQLAESILTNADLRKKLWEDQVLRDKLAQKLGTFKTIRDFENLIAQRVKSYSL
ncbi:MAG: START domain-containing protein [Syntrophaceae bacterium]|nr:START domain-containing protein [Syntrophaceae bacterium]